MQQADSSRKLVFIGAGGHSTSLIETASSAGYQILGFIDAKRSGQTHLNFPVYESPEKLSSPETLFFCIAIGDNSSRARIWEELKSKLRLEQFPPLVHKSATVSAHSKLGWGTVVMQGAIIGCNTSVGDFCIINTKASLDHDCSMGHFSSLAPGATTGGRVSIGERSAISIGAIIRHHITIGADSVLGAGSYLHSDLPSNSVAYGTPARVIRSREKDTPYL